MDRRHFLHTSSGLVAGMALGARSAAALEVDTPGAPLARLGLELFSVRKEMAKDFDRTLAAIRAIGYTDVELLWSFNNFGKSTAEVKAALAREGLRAPSAHMDPTTLFINWEKRLETAKTLGHEYLIVPSFSGSTSTTLDDWRAWADRFNEAGAVARRHGVWLAFHNEADHMKPIDGQIPYDVFVQRTDASVVRHQLDVGNMAIGGGDPLRYLERFKDRYWSFHLKDAKPDRSGDTELGKGILDFKKILAAIPNIAAKPCYVEQEDMPDPLASVKRDFDYLKKL
jgi:sugar phosphate isomerase/epimerase